MTVNVELFRKIRDRIAQYPESFDMNNWEAVGEGTGCGTTRCVAGWALFYHHGETPLHEIVPRVSYSVDAAEVLGIDARTADGLFYCPEAVAEEVVELFAAGDEAAAQAVLHAFRVEG